MQVKTSRLQAIRGKLIITGVAVLALVAQPMYGLVASQVAHAVSGFPSTNAHNKTVDRPHVVKNDSTANSMELEFFHGGQNGMVYFEVRVDGAPSTLTNPHQIVDKDGNYDVVSDTDWTAGNYDPADRDVQWTGVTLLTPGTSIKQEYTGVDSTVEVRYALGANDANRFDWTTFNVAPAVDSTAPTTTFVAPKGVVGNTFTVSGVANDDEALSRVYVQLVKRDTGARHGGKTIHLSGTSASWSHTYNLADLNLSEGTYAAHVSVTDRAGNSTSSGWSDNFIVDTTAPEVHVDKPGELAGNTFTISGNVSDANGLNRVYVQLVNRDDNKRYGGKTIHLLQKEGAYHTWEHPYDATELNLPEGTYAAHASAVDRAGNAASSGWSDNFKLDKTAPTISIKHENTGTTSGTKGNDPYYSHISFKLHDAHSGLKQVVLNGNPYNQSNERDYLNWSNINKSHLTKDGVNEIFVRDQAGNVSQTIEFYYDPDAPQASIEVSSAASAGNVHRGPVTITGVVDPSEKNIKSHWFEITNPDGTLSYSHNLNTDDLTYSFTLDTSNGDGEYKLRYVATDKAGNRNDANGSTTETVTVDNSINFGFSSNTFSNTTPTITGTATWNVDDAPVANTDITVTVNDETQVVSTNENGTWQFTPSTALANNTYPVTINGSEVGQITIAVASSGLPTNLGNTNTSGSLSQPSSGSNDDAETSSSSGLVAFNDTLITTGNVGGPFNTGTIEDDDDADVLGAQSGDDSGSVAGASTNVAQAADNPQGFTLAGLAWYWWLAILAGVGLLWWLLAAWRHRKEDQSLV